MVIQPGMIGKAKFIPFIKKMNVFEYGSNGVVVERENKQIYVYATNASCSKIYCTVSMGSDSFLKQYNIVVRAHNDHILTVDAGFVHMVFDYEAQKAYVSKEGFQVTGKRWTEDVQGEWDPEFYRLFGIDF